MDKCVVHFYIPDFRCLFRQRRKRAALCLNVFAVRPSIGQPLADDTLGEFGRALAIVYAKRSAVVMAEIKLREITLQVRFADVMPPLRTEK